MPSARRPKSRIICGVAWGDMNVEKTPIFMLALLAFCWPEGKTMVRAELLEHARVRCPLAG